jgi:AraC-like DNA-binding protein
MGGLVLFYSENELFFDHWIQLHIIKCGKRSHALDHSFGPKSRKHSWLIFVKRGEGVLTMEGRSFKFREHCIFCTFPNMEFEYTFSGEADIIWICFDEAFSILPNHLGLHAHSPVKYIENFAEVENAFDAIYSLSHSNLQSDQYRILSHFYTLFAILTEKNRAIRIPDTSYVDYAIRYFENNYMDEIYVSDLSKELGIESSYFSKLFKSKIGCSPIEYLTQVRVDKAKQLLKFPPYSVKDVAKAVGFADALYFSKKFKHYTGMSPSQFSKTI